MVGRTCRCGAMRFSRSVEGGSDQAVRARIQALVDFLESIQMRDTP